MIEGKIMKGTSDHDFAANDFALIYGLLALFPWLVWGGRLARRAGLKIASCDVRFRDVAHE